MVTDPLPTATPTAFHRHADPLPRHADPLPLPCRPPLDVIPSVAEESKAPVLPIQVRLSPPKPGDTIGNVKMTNKPIRFVLFDLDNTLLDRATAFGRVFEHWYHTLPAVNRPQDKAEFVSRMARRGHGNEPIPEIYQDMLDEWPGSFPSLATAAKAHFDLMPKAVSLHPKTEAMLKCFRSRGIPVGVVTNGGSETQLGKLRNTGIAALVAACVVSEEFGARKPDPAIFRHALNLIGAKSDSTLFVGDNVEEDIVGANRINMRTAWMSLGRPWNSGLPRPDYILDAAWEVEGIVLQNPVT